jgi:hypothetical protein
LFSPYNLPQSTTYLRRNALRLSALCVDASLTKLKSSGKRQTICTPRWTLTIFATALDSKYAVAASKNDVKIFTSLFAENNMKNRKTL